MLTTYGMERIAPQYNSSSVSNKRVGKERKESDFDGQGCFPKKIPLLGMFSKEISIVIYSKNFIKLKEKYENP